ncbi:Cryptic loci regulator 2 [Leucoagaricus sp. SymC.cos]|nr:Cryptic loci regulator 2 [Leucoagaricus sp. SymC.cos]
MSGRRVGQPNVLFSPSTIYLDFPRSDGDATKWPTNTTRVVDGEGQVNFMEFLDIEESGQVRKWRASVGKAIATKLEMQGDVNNYVLRSWPRGYRMYDHHKGPVGNPRHDLYLYGCARGRFRSINEFIPHAIWLFSDPTMNYANCECKYCTRQPQKGITASMGDILGTPVSVSPTPRPRKPREKTRVNRPYASVQNILKPALKPSAHIQDTPTLAERNSDLRAVFSRNSMKLKRWYRDGEVVWCELHTPIPGPSGVDSTIVFWPGLIQEYKLKSTTIPRENPPTSTNPSQAPNLGPVEQSIVYLVELFAVNRSVHVSDRNVIPYQAYIPHDDIILAMQALDPERLDFDRDSISNFNPCPGNQPPSFEDAAGPYAVALQIASNVSQFFSVTDEWEFSYTLPTPLLAPSISQAQSENSLHAAINAAGRMNSSAATSLNPNNSSPHLYRNISSARPGAPQTEVDKLANDILGPNSGSPGVHKTQIRFQGLWWGPERIWVDDFVRLKVSRRSLAPYGAQDISPPAGPSKQAIENYKLTGRSPSEIGAGTRGVFMRIDALFVVETMTEGRKRKECRASGPLFELVDEDWDENEDEDVKQHKQRFQATTEALRPTKPLPARSMTSPLSNYTSTPTAIPAYYLPPQAPVGYRFRPIISPNHEVVISLSLISGRYYPGILMHPLLVAEMNRAALVPMEDGGILKYGHIWALDGLNGGFHCSVDPDKFSPGRTKMLERSDKEGYAMLQNFKRQALAEANGEGDSIDGSDVDMLARDDDAMSQDERDRAPGSSNAYRMDRDGDVTMQ